MVNEELQEVMVVGNRIPRKFFITQGHGESDITVHAGSYHLALRAAGVERYNHTHYSSILPAIAREVKKPKEYTHGAVLETIAAVSHSTPDTNTQGKPTTAGIIYAWLHPKSDLHQKEGGLVCEYGGHGSEKEAQRTLEASLNELYENGFRERYELGEHRIFLESFVPKKIYGTALVIIGFLNYVVPVIERVGGGTSRALELLGKQK